MLSLLPHLLLLLLLLQLLLTRHCTASVARLTMRPSEYLFAIPAWLSSVIATSYEGEVYCSCLHTVNSACLCVCEGSI